MSTSATITVTNNDGGGLDLLQFRTVYFTFDHAALVAAKRSRADGRDLRVTYPTRGDIGVLVLGQGTATCRVFFALQEGIQPSQSDTYTFHFGNLSAPDRYPVPVRDLSQWDAVNATFKDAYWRKQPVAWFDPFTYKWDGSAWVAYSVSDALDTDLYHVRGTWTKASVGVYAAKGQSPSAFALVKGLDINSCRVRIGMLSTGVGASACGAILNSLSTALQGYSCSLATTYVLAATTEWAADVPSVISAFAVSNVDSVLVEVTMAYYNKNGYANFGGTVSSFFDTSHSQGYAGIFEASAAGGGTTFFPLIVELWDGVADADIEIDITIPAVSLPCPSFVGQEEVAYTQGRMGSPELRTTRSAVAVADGIAERFDVGSLRLVWENVPEEDFYEVLAYFRSLYGGSFQFTAPGDSARYFVMRPGSLSMSKNSPVAGIIEVVLDKVPL